MRFSIHEEEDDMVSKAQQVPGKRSRLSVLLDFFAVLALLGVIVTLLFWIATPPASGQVAPRGDDEEAQPQTMTVMGNFTAPGGGVRLDLSDLDRDAFPQPLVVRLGSLWAMRVPTNLLGTLWVVYDERWEPQGVIYVFPRTIYTHSVMSVPFKTDEIDFDPKPPEPGPPVPEPTPEKPSK